MTKYLVLECLKKTGVINGGGPTIQKITEFRFALVGAESPEQAIEWVRDNEGWSPSIRVKNDGFGVFNAQRAQSVVFHACDTQESVLIRDGRVRVMLLDEFAVVIESIPMYMFYSIVGQTTGMVLNEISEFEEQPVSP